QEVAAVEIDLLHERARVAGRLRRGHRHREAVVAHPRDAERERAELLVEHAGGRAVGADDVDLGPRAAVVGDREPRARRVPAESARRATPAGSAGSGRAPVARSSSHALVPELNASVVPSVVIVPMRSRLSARSNATRTGCGSVGAARTASPPRTIIATPAAAR